jgi:fermentation-respiration switch protein FrsA (DUF1100 family)
VQGPGAWRRLLPAIARDVAEQPLLTAAELRAARVPILLVYGDRDIFVPVDHAVSLYRQLPDARLFVAPDAPHQVMVSRPGLFNDAAALFYRSTEQTARARAGVEPTGPARAPAEGAVALDPALAAAHHDTDQPREEIA